jgi:hypothetical protein
MNWLQMEQRTLVTMSFCDATPLDSLMLLAMGTL